jgi:hypothetical protein
MGVAAGYPTAPLPRYSPGGLPGLSEGRPSTVGLPANDPRPVKGIPKLKPLAKSLPYVGALVTAYELYRWYAGQAEIPGVDAGFHHVWDQTRYCTVNSARTPVRWLLSGHSVTCDGGVAMATVDGTPYPRQLASGKWFYQVYYEYNSTSLYRGHDAFESPTTTNDFVEPWREATAPQPARSPVWWFDPLVTQPSSIPMRDPLFLPIGTPAPVPAPVPFRQLPRVRPDPNRDPRERPNRGPRPARRPSRNPALWRWPGNTLANRPSLASQPVHKRLPPGPGVKEKKYLVTPKMAMLMGALLQVTEAADAIKAVYDTLPKWARDRCARERNKSLSKTAGKAQCLWNYAYLIDPEEAFLALFAEKLADAPIGKASGAAGKGMREKMDRPVSRIPQYHPEGETPSVEEWWVWLYS